MSAAEDELATPGFMPRSLSTGFKFRVQRSRVRM